MVINKKASQMLKLVEVLFIGTDFDKVVFFWKCFYFFFNFMTYNYWIINNTFCIFTIFRTTGYRIPKITFWHIQCSFGFLYSHQHLSLFHFWLKLHFLPSNLHSNLHDICFVNVLDVLICFYYLKNMQV